MLVPPAALVKHREGAWRPLARGALLS